ncbi:ankyrin repeat domain-containing protein [Leptospira sp. 2 VSF19]|uniref:Ankyrin repeat domain-containing protein n=1 Tax=Leptospira soteropolitanensis TaxID=2950025 RepID=A0AAW5VAR6_9LEPT|nr:ankyrin repeat domain-containing protein [Leptospira soteropolitanensis]MCW7491156.1 ankyrin repeat domain-containing protein [Leptospira soteropolitanensis]MCW7498740.1 ankyrin repeat domain-containing protein [Leptospira soteropolitanensis]MCW7521667.1 ankyrin repeat domain-containing protein [Leptospira soteropolitanensis]MCW7524844.1 ankyrin repeat domain-containing protein [Leptospira soteropolitanensis]MCW7528711.1 ankyrin repeat domain-containing protein [Leptospira soteropolitanensi
MKTILSCSNCFSGHSISTFKVEGKKGKYRCKKCGSWNHFDYRKEPEKASSDSLVLFDLNFKDQIPEHRLQGQILGRYTTDFISDWSNEELVFLKDEEGTENDLRISISGLPEIVKLKNLLFDITTETPSKNLKIIINQNVNDSPFRLSVTVDMLDERFVSGKLYLAIADDWNTFLHGSFTATRIYKIKFDEHGDSDKKLPEFIPNELSAKIFALSGNILALQEVFLLLDQQSKDELLTLVMYHWPENQSTISEVHFKEGNLLVAFQLTQRKLNETLIFLFSNQVVPTQKHWALFHDVVCHSESEPLFIPILKHKFPDSYQTHLGENLESTNEDKTLDWLEADDIYLLDSFVRTVGSLDYVVQDPIRNPLGFSLLQECFVRAKYKSCMRLLERGADPNQFDVNGETAIFKLCQDSTLRLQQKTTLMDELIRRGAKVNLQSINGMTPLHWCSVFGEPSMAKRLIQAGIDIHIADNHGSTALHEACKFGNSAVLALLLESGAKSNSKTLDEKTGRDLAFENLEIAELEGDEEKKNRYKRVLSLLDVYGG